MGQVPDQVNEIEFGLVGDGRLARHIAHYFNLLKIPYRQWSRQAEQANGSSALEVLGHCKTILVAISDSAIEPWIESVRAQGLAPLRFVHFSGALVTKLAVGVHPLMTFGKGFYELADYQKIPFICEEGGPSFKEIFPKLSNQHFSIPAAQKPLYHALCVMSGNFTVLLWQKMFGDMEKKLGVSSEAAIPYLERIIGNLKKDPKAALTGPLSRGDNETIQKNLDSLAGDRFQKVYQSFVEAYTHERS